MLSLCSYNDADLSGTVYAHSLEKLRLGRRVEEAMFCTKDYREQ